jgi:DNA-binding NtrC family response regulator
MSKILVVDDREDLRFDLAEAAQDRGREVLQARSAKEAIEMIRNDGFDAVVTDVRMERSSSGLDVLSAAKAKDVDTQVIVVTSFDDDPQMKAHLLELGAYDYIERNEPGLDLLQTLREKISDALGFRSELERRRVTDA